MSNKDTSIHSRETSVEHKDSAIFVMPRKFFKQQIAYASQFTNELNLTVSPRDGLNVQTLDGAHVCLLKISMPHTGMEAVRWTMKTPREFVIGVFVKVWLKVLDIPSMRDAEFVRLVLNPDRDEAAVEFVNYLSTDRKPLSQGKLNPIDPEKWNSLGDFRIKLGDFQNDPLDALGELEPFITVALPSQSVFLDMNSMYKSADDIAFVFEGKVESINLKESATKKLKPATPAKKKPPQDDEGDDWVEEEPPEPQHEGSGDGWDEDDSAVRSALGKRSAQITAAPPRFVTRNVYIQCKGENFRSNLRFDMHQANEALEAADEQQGASDENWKHVDLIPETDPSKVREDEKLPAALQALTINAPAKSVVSFKASSASSALTKGVGSAATAKALGSKNLKGSMKISTARSGVVLQERSSTEKHRYQLFSTKFLVRAAAGYGLSDTILLSFYEANKEMAFVNATFDLGARGSLSTIVAAKSEGSSE